MTEYCITCIDIADEKQMIQWAINNCQSFTYKTIKDARREEQFYTYHDFYFEEEKDAMWFRLNWS
jgi:hypothetical protein